MTPDAFFKHRLREWAAGTDRPLPWKGERDPYRIWLSEIILQQTRVEQGMPYYLRMTERFPDVRTLAAATEDEVLKCWEGLGYYSRARNLHAAAQYIAGACSGRFPDTYDSLRALKGVGDYTAAAIASFAFGLPHAVLDGNVYRVLARFFGIKTPADTGEGKRQFGDLASKLLDTARPGTWNQALMDFGALQCVPGLPACNACPLSSRCRAYSLGAQENLPVRAKQNGKKSRFFLYAVVECGGEVALRRRSGRDIWRNLYEFPMKELQEPIRVLAGDAKALLPLLFDCDVPGGLRAGRVTEPFKQALTHQQITAVFVEIMVEKEAKKAVLNHVLLENSHFEEQFKLKKMYALPRIIDRYWQEKNISLFSV